MATLQDILVNDPAYFYEPLPTGRSRLLDLKYYVDTA
jgi:hypothetical protein